MSKKRIATTYESHNADFGSQCVRASQVKDKKWKAPEIEIPSVPNERTVLAARRFAYDILAACDYADANDRRTTA